MSDAQPDSHTPRSEKDLFLAALELEPEARAELLASIQDEALRRRVARLLDVDTAGKDTAGKAALVDSPRPLDDLLAGIDASPAPDSDVSTSSSSMPERLGQYRILRKLGEGGMGVVYEAEQGSPRRRVALKLIRAGLDSEEVRRRFQRESEVLGRLHHPGIAQIHEAGVAEMELGAQPFFAMELVEGRPLLEFARDESLGVRERLVLMQSICAAVEHSHQQGVIHRDLKPGNILVDRAGQPKILDFGVARVTEGDIEAATLETRAGQLVGTLPYMSPEQLGGDSRDIDTRADVYALGVIGFELLAGVLPYELRDTPLPRAVHIMSTTEPRRLGSIARELRGDVEAIIGKALEHDKDRRYSSAAALREDIARCLRDEPVLARRQTALYQLAKIARRHRVLVGSAAVVVVALVVAAAVSVWQARIATRERDLARQRLDQAETFSVLIHTTLASVSPDRDGRNVRVVDMFRRLVPAMEERLRDEPVARAALSDTLGVAFYRIGAYDDAEPLLREALRIRSGLDDPEHEIELAETLHNLGALLRRKGALDEAETFLGQALATRRRLLGADHDKIAETLDQRGLLLRARGDLDGARGAFEDALAMRRRLHGEDGVAVAHSLRHLANLAEYTGDYEAAQRGLEKALAISQRALGEDHSDLAASLVELAELLSNRGRPEEAAPLFEKALAIQRRRLGNRHPDLAIGLTKLARVATDRRDFETSEKALAEALSILRDAHGEEHADIADVLGSFCELYYLRGSIGLAEDYARQAYEMRLRLFGEGHPAIAPSLQDLAICAQWKGNDAEATRYIEEATAIFRARPTENRQRLAFLLHGAGIFAKRRGALDEAEGTLREALDLRREVLGPEHPLTAQTEYELGELYARLGRGADALALYEHVRAVHARVYGDGHERDAVVIYGMAMLRNAAGDFAEALELLELTSERFARIYPPDHWVVHSVESARGDCLRRLGRFEEAERFLVSGYEGLCARLHPTNGRSIKALRSLIELYREMGRTEDAARYEAMLPQSEPASDANAAGEDGATPREQGGEGGGL